MNTKYIAGAIALAVVIAGASFWGGMAYAKSQPPVFRSGNAALAGGSFAGARTGARGGGVTAGSIIAKDATSITVKMQDGSTKIVLLSSGTQIMKSASGTLDDLSVGTNVIVMGSGNADGSMTASSVQLRPEGSVIRGTSQQ